MSVVTEVVREQIHEGGQHGNDTFATVLVLFFPALSKSVATGAASTLPAVRT